MSAKGSTRSLTFEQVLLAHTQNALMPQRRQDVQCLACGRKSGHVCRPVKRVWVGIHDGSGQSQAGLDTC